MKKHVLNIGDYIKFSDKYGLDTNWIIYEVVGISEECNSVLLKDLRGNHCGVISRNSPHIKLNKNDLIKERDKDYPCTPHKAYFANQVPLKKLKL